MKIISLLLVVALFTSCSSNKSLHQDQKRINFCDIPNHIGQKVYIKCIYSGLEEYWSLSPINKKCKDDLRVQFEDGSYLPPVLFREKFRKVHSYYWEYYLILDLVGTFETGEHYGHLGSNNYFFKVDHIIKCNR